MIESLPRTRLRNSGRPIDSTCTSVRAMTVAVRVSQAPTSAASPKKSPAMTFLQIWRAKMVATPLLTT